MKNCWNILVHSQLKKDRMTEIGRRLEEIKKERKVQAKITVMFDFQKIQIILLTNFYIYNTLKYIFSNYRDFYFFIKIPVFEYREKINET